MKDKLVLLFVIIIVCINLISFLSCAVDKDHAKRGRYRVRESILLKLSIFFGSYGMLLSMIIFRNKTRKPKFSVTVPLLVLLHSAILYGLYYFFYL